MVMQNIVSMIEEFYFFEHSEMIGRKVSEVRLYCVHYGHSLTNAL